MRKDIITNYIFKKGTEVKSVTYEKDLTSKSTGWSPIIFDYEFSKEEFMEERDGIKIFERKSEDGKIHQYFVKG